MIGPHSPRHYPEPGINDEGRDDDPFGETSPEHILKFLELRQAA